MPPPPWAKTHAQNSTYQRADVLSGARAYEGVVHGVDAAMRAKGVDAEGSPRSTLAFDACARPEAGLAPPPAREVIALDDDDDFCSAQYALRYLATFAKGALVAPSARLRRGARAAPTRSRFFRATAATLRGRLLPNFSRPRPSPNARRVYALSARKRVPVPVPPRLEQRNGKRIKGLVRLIDKALKHGRVVAHKRITGT